MYPGQTSHAGFCCQKHHPFNGDESGRGQSACCTAERWAAEQRASTSNDYLLAEHLDAFPIHVLPLKMVDSCVRMCFVCLFCVCVCVCSLHPIITHHFCWSCGPRYVASTECLALYPNMDPGEKPPHESQKCRGFLERSCFHHQFSLVIFRLQTVQGVTERRWLMLSSFGN